MEGVKKPKAKQTEFDFYDEIEAKKVISALYQEPRRRRLFILGATIRNLKRIRLDDLRHSSATLLIEVGASMKAIQKRLGHAKHQTTADIYALVTKKVSRDTTEKFDKFAPRPQPVPNPSPSTNSGS